VKQVIARRLNMFFCGVTDESFIIREGTSIVDLVLTKPAYTGLSPDRNASGTRTHVGGA